MKTKFIIASLLACSLSSFAQVAKNRSSKLSAMTQFYLADKQQLSKNELPKNYVYKRDAAGNWLISAMVKVNTKISLPILADLGVHVGTKAGNIWTVSVPVTQFEQFVALEGLEYVQIDEPLMSNMDAVRVVTHTDSVHNGNAPLPMPYTGKNVVVGIIDAGFDYNHPTLKDTLGSKWRIKKVWEQKSLGTPPLGFAYGNEMTDSNTIKSKGTDLPLFSHGAHVAGIAAGSGYGSLSNSQYRGISYGSDLLLVGITPDSSQWMNTGMSDIIDGLNYIYSYASSVGKPAVANLSWGCTIGSHDGTSLFSQACDALTGKGKIFVCAAGNNGSNYIHLNKKFTTTDTLVSTELALPTSLNKTWLDIWGDTAKSFCVKITLYNGISAGSTTGYICLDDVLHSYSLVGTDGDTCFVDVLPTFSTFNSKPRMLFRIYQKSTNAICVTAKASEGSINMWNGYVQKTTGYYGSLNASIIPNTYNGNTDYTTGDMADTKSAIAVASYASKVNFTNLAGGSISYASYVGLGRRAPYSSKGPTADGRVKPDISAPGLMVGSAVSSLDTSFSLTGSNASSTVTQFHNPLDSKDYYYAMLTGTSMASPVVAGIVGLMLEANPNLDPQKTIEILKATALHDIYTGIATPTGSNLWGHGKVNAFAAVNKAIEALGISSSAGIAAIECRMYPNPSIGQLFVDFISSRNEKVQIEVFDLSGKMMLSQNWDVTTGANTTVLDLSSLSSGLYFTRLSAASQGNITYKTLLR